MALEPDSENERTSAFEWLMADPEHRSIESPSRTDAVLNYYAARDRYPDHPFTMDQFTCTRLPAAMDRATRLLPLHLWFF